MKIESCSTVFFYLQNRLLIFVPGVSLIRLGTVSLLVAYAPAGSHLFRNSRRSLHAFHSNQLTIYM